MERLNRTIIAKLAKSCNGNWKDWDDHLKYAIYSYRVTLIQKLKASPFELIYGRQPKVISDVGTENDIEKQFKESEMEVIQRTKDLRLQLQREARDMREQEINKQKNEEPKDYQIGQIVMRRKHSFERENKLDNKWCGPYRIIKDFGNGGLEIENPFGKRYRYNKSDIRPMEGRDPEDWSQDKEGWMLPEEKDVSGEFLQMKLKL